MYILFQNTITVDELKQCQKNLNTFVNDVEDIYGKRFATFNIHTVKHSVISALYCGPLWAISTFPFENANFHLMLEVKGPNPVYEQIARKILSINILETIIDESQSEVCVQYFLRLFD